MRDPSTERPPDSGVANRTGQRRSTPSIVITTLPLVAEIGSTGISVSSKMIRS
ncbi:MAG: hypothetical protein L0Y44_13665 [Phycisphaerales bacterium]|nr:hypothetical protein [Phycisphaerales bacterium]